MSNELTVAGNNDDYFVPSEKLMTAFLVIAKHAANSKLYERLGGESGILSTILLARELGISPMMALAGGIHNIQGKPEMSARMMNAKIRQAGHRLEILQSDKKGAVLKGIRKDTGEEYTCSYTVDDAHSDGNLDKAQKGGPWKTALDDMLFKTALTKVARRLFTDVIGECYVEGEYQSVIDDKEEAKKRFATKPENKIDVKYEPIKIAAPQPVIEDAKIESVVDVSLLESVTKEQLFELEDLLATKDETFKTVFFTQFKIADIKELKQKDFEMGVKILKKAKLKSV